jgi:hypothetical protein
MAPGLELDLPFGVVEQLAIVENGDGPILVENRLLTVVDPDNAETLMGDADPGREQGAAIVRTAMEQHGAHALHLGPIGLPPTLKVDHTCKATHFASLEIRPG